MDVALFPAVSDTVRTRKRYVRYEPANELRLTERDLAILCDLHDRRFMNARQLQTLYGSNVPERLRFLFRHGYIDRPTAQKHWRIREGGGSYPLIYALSNRGARALVVYKRRHNAMRRDWSELNRELSELSSHIPHEMGVADVYVWFRRLADALPNRTLLQGFELAHGTDGRALEIPGTTKLLEPDFIPALVPSTDLGKEELFFVERHMGTEPNTRYSSPQLEHLTGKYEGYLSYARAKKCYEQFGIANFRVLTVTSGGAINVGNIVKAAEAVCDGVGAGRFLVTTAAALDTSDPLEVTWFDASGNAVRLAAL
jgi:hypothetical protein